MAYKKSNFPENGYDSFQELYDIPYDKIPLVQEFQTLKLKQSKTQVEQDRLNELTNSLSLYIIDPNKWNLFCDALTGVQKFFLENVDGYVDAMQVSTKTYMDTLKAETLAYMDARKTDMDSYKVETLNYMDARKSDMDSYKIETKEYMDLQKVDTQNFSNTKKSEMEIYVNNKEAEVTGYVNVEKTNLTSYINTQKQTFDSGIANFKYMGSFNLSATYGMWNSVRYNEDTYISKINNNKGNYPPSGTTLENTYWFKSTEKGAKGQDGTNLVYKGIYNISASYTSKDLVNYNGILYVAKNDNSNILPTNTATWEVFPINSSMVVQKEIPTNSYSGMVWLEVL